MTQQDKDMENLRRQVEDAQKRIEAWPDKHEDLANLLPTEGLCTLCYLAGKAEAPKHDLILLCPHPSALLVPYRWSDGRLRAGSRYMADKSAFVDMLKAITERYAGVNPAATIHWARLHGAATDLLAACELAILALTGHEDEAVALEALLAAVALAKGKAE